MDISVAPLTTQTWAASRRYSVKTFFKIFSKYSITNTNLKCKRDGGEGGGVKYTCDAIISRNYSLESKKHRITNTILKYEGDGE